jgi:hypothetical protein
MGEVAGVCHGLFADYVESFYVIRRSETAPAEVSVKRFGQKKVCCEYPEKDSNHITQALGPRFGRIAVALNSRFS